MPVQQYVKLYSTVPFRNTTLSEPPEEIDAAPSGRLVLKCLTLFVPGFAINSVVITPWYPSASVGPASRQKSQVSGASGWVVLRQRLPRKFMLYRIPSIFHPSAIRRLTVQSPRKRVAVSEIFFSVHPQSFAVFQSMSLNRSGIADVFTAALDDASGTGVIVAGRPGEGGWEFPVPAGWSPPGESDMHPAVEMLRRMRMQKHFDIRFIMVLVLFFPSKLF